MFCFVFKNGKLGWVKELTGRLKSKYGVSQFRADLRGRGMRQLQTPTQGEDPKKQKNPSFIYPKWLQEQFNEKPQLMLQETEQQLHFSLNMLLYYQKRKQLILWMLEQLMYFIVAVSLGLVYLNDAGTVTWLKGSISQSSYYLFIHNYALNNLKKVHLVHKKVLFVCFALSGES